jgi:hypothetical protein
MIDFRDRVLMARHRLCEGCLNSKAVGLYAGEVPAHLSHLDPPPAWTVRALCGLCLLRANYRDSQSKPKDGREVGE